MKKISMFSIVLGFAMTVIEGSAQAQNVGDTATVPGWRWVDVMNTQSVAKYQDEPVEYQMIYGDICGIESGGSVLVKAIDGERLLLEYTAPGVHGGTPCPTGIVFFAPKDEFIGMTQKYDEAMKAVQSTLDFVNKALGIEPRS